MKHIHRTAIVGMGALGMMYGVHIMKQQGREAVSFIVDEERLRRYRQLTFTCNGEVLDADFQSCDVQEDFDLVIVAVKYNSLASALETMQNCVGPDTIILSVMNGIDSEEIIAKRYGKEHLIYTVAQGMDAMRDGSTLRYTQMGNLCIGVPEGFLQENVDAVEAFFQEIQMPYKREEDILYRMWGKWMLNVGINQTCMVYDTTYSGATQPGEARETLIASMQEVIELSKHTGVNLKQSEMDFYLMLISRLDPEGFPSMAQDRKAGRRSEVEMFAGTVIRMAEQYGLEVPANRFLYEQVQKIEADYGLLSC